MCLKVSRVGPGLEANPCILNGVLALALEQATYMQTALGLSLAALGLGGLGL